MRKKTVRVISIAMAVAATASAVFTSSALGYYEDISPGIAQGNASVDISVDGNDGEEELPDAEYPDETSTLSINLMSAGGYVVIDEGEENQQLVLLEKPDDGNVYIDVYDSDGVMISRGEISEDGLYTYPYEVDTDMAVSIKAVANENCVVWKYDVAVEGVSEETGFLREDYLEEFECPVIVDADKDFYVSFVDAGLAEMMIEEGTAEDQDVVLDPNLVPAPMADGLSVNDDITVNGPENSEKENDDLSVTDSEDESDNDLSVSADPEETEKDPEENFEEDLEENSEENPEEDSAENPEENQGDESSGGTSSGTATMPSDGDLSIDTDGASSGDTEQEENEIPDDVEPETDVAPDVDVNPEDTDSDVNPEDVESNVMPDGEIIDPGTETLPEDEDTGTDALPNQDLSVEIGDVPAEENPEDQSPEDQDSDEEQSNGEDVIPDEENPNGEEAVDPENPEGGDIPENLTAPEYEFFSSSVTALESEAIAPGEPANLLVEAQNISDVPAELDLYFCEIAEEMSEDKAVWDVYLKNPAMSVESEDLEGEDGLTVSLRMEDGTSIEKNLQMSWKLENGEAVSKYAFLELPAWSETDFALSVYSEQDASLTVIPIIVYGDGESTYGEVASVVWKTPEPAEEEEQQPEKPEHFLENVVGTELLDASKFATARLVVLTENPKTVIDPEHLIANYDNIYLLQYGSQEQAMNAYMYYSLVASAVEPDTAMSIAGDLHVDGIDTMPVEQEISDLHVGDPEQNPGEGEDSEATETVDSPESQTPEEEDVSDLSVSGTEVPDIIIPETVDPGMSQDSTEVPDSDTDEEATQPEVPETTDPESPETTEPDESESLNGTAPEEIQGISITSENNPIAFLASEDASAKAQTQNKVIALIDTGVAGGPNIIDRVSVIDDVLNGGTHGDDMAKFITEMNPGARILSIRALGNDGFGSISAVISAIEYAINSQVDIINMSMYSEKSLATSVLEVEIQKAIDSGIIVVGSSGNDGQDVSGYVPGSIERVQTIGSVNAEGARRGFSNYGDLVDYYMVSDSTSEAAARFSGFISLYGLDAAVNDNSGTVFTEAGDPVVGDTDIHVNTNDFDSTKTDDTIYDPVIENYVKENADPSYVGEGKLYIKNVMDVYATIVREEDIGPDDTIDTICGLNDDPKVLLQHMGRVPVYQFGDNTEYFVIYADLMHNDSRARIFGYMLGENNVYGHTVDDFYFDQESGLMYIPQKDFYGDDGVFYLNYLRAQIIYVISEFDYYSAWNSSAVTVTEGENGELDQGIKGDKITTQLMSVQVGKHMDVDSMLVSVNGFPIEGNRYAYDPDTGILTVGFSSCTVQSIWVQAEKSEDVADPEPGLRAAYGSPAHPGPNEGSDVSPSAMIPVSDIQCPADPTKIANGTGFSTYAFVKYPGGNGNWSGADNGGQTVYPYVPTVHYSNDPGLDLLKWIGGNGAPGAYPSPLKEASNAGFMYPFALKLDSINIPEINLEDLPDDLYLALACVHLKQGLGIDIGGGANMLIHLRVVEINMTASPAYVVFAVYTDTTNGQNGIGLFKVLINNAEGSVKITKMLTDPEWAGVSERVKLSTEFSIYRDKGCNSLYTNADFNGHVTLTDDDNNPRTAVSATIEGLPADTDFYMKETGRCPGCKQNDKVYKFRVTKDKVTSDFEIVSGGSGTTNIIENPPLRGIFKIIKSDKDNAKLLEGAVFRVKYYTKIADRNAHKNQIKTWFFKTGSKGEAKYCETNYLPTWTDKKGKTYKSDPPLLTKDKKWFLPLGYLTVKEVEAPSGYKIDKTVYNLEIDTTDPTKLECPVAEITVENGTTIDQYWKVRIQTKKVDDKSKELEGAVFSVWLDEECKYDYAGDITSQADGLTDILTVDEIPWTDEEITLYIKESKAPPGFAVSPKVYEVTFKRADFEKLNDDQKKEGELKLFIPDSESGIPNEPGWNISVDLKKIDEDGNGLAGAVFGIYDDPLCTPEHELGRLTSTVDGSNVFTWSVDKSVDTYYLYCKEITPPEGYSLSSEIYILEFKKSDYDALDPSKLAEGLKKTFGIDSSVSGAGADVEKKGIVNKKGWPARVKAKKVDSSGTGLEGAVFGIYEDEACSTLLGQIKSTDTGETDEFSYVVPKDQDSITFYCKELEAPSGYDLKDDIYEVTFSKSEWDALSDEEKKQGVLKWIESEDGIVNDKTEITPTPTTTPPVTPPTAGVYVQKETTANADIMDLEAYDLVGAEFEVVNEDTDEVVGTLTVGDQHLPDYLSEILPLPDNSTSAGPKITNYLVRETKPPKGHILCNDVYRFHVTMPIDKDKLFKAPFVDEPYFCDKKFMIEKLGKKGDVVKGVVFKVELFDSDSPDPDKLKRTWYLESDENGIVLMDKAHISTRKGYVSDDFYMHNDQIVIPIGCYLQVTEVSAPAEYVLDDTPFNFLTDQGVELSKEVRDDYDPCSIKIKKYAQDGTTVLAGVEFKLTFIEQTIKSTEKRHQNFKRLLNPGESITLSTDENGELTFENLDQGTYMLEELRTVPEQNLLKEPIYVTLPMKMSEDEAIEYGNVDFGSAKLDESYTDAWFFYDCTYEITNSPILHLPVTGNNGMWKYGIIGVGLLAAVAAWYILGTKTKKHKNFKI